MNTLTNNYVVGLIGGIATGKSTIADYFKNFNIPVIDTDSIGKNLYLPGQPGFNPIVNRYGQEILSNHHINRQKLAEIIYSNPHEKAWLEDLLHPLIREASLKELKANCTYNILMIPLLKDRHSYPLDQVILTYASQKTQIERLKKYRHMNEEMAQLIINNQPTFNQQLKIADYIIDTDKDLNEVFNETEQVHLKLSLLFNT